MDFNTIMTVVIILGVAIFLIPMIRLFGSPRKNNDERQKYIERQVLEIGGTIISVEKMTKSSCPYNKELGLDQDAVYVPYKVTYRINGIDVEGWAIIIIERRFGLAVIMTKDKWIMRL